MKVIISRRNTNSIEIVLLSRDIATVVAPINADLDYIKYYVSNRLRKGQVGSYNQIITREKTKHFNKPALPKQHALGNIHFAQPVTNNKFDTDKSASMVMQSAKPQKRECSQSMGITHNNTVNSNNQKGQIIDNINDKQDTRRDRFIAQYQYRTVALYGKLFDVEQEITTQTESTTGKDIITIPKNQYKSLDGRRKALYVLVQRECKEKIPKIISVVGTKLSLCPSIVTFRRMREGWGKEHNTHITIDYQTVQLPAVAQLYIVTYQLLCLAHRPQEEVFNNKMREILQQDHASIQQSLHQYDYLKELFV